MPFSHWCLLCGVSLWAQEVYGYSEARVIAVTSRGQIALRASHRVRAETTVRLSGASGGTMGEFGHGQCSGCGPNDVVYNDKGTFDDLTTRWTLSPGPGANKKFCKCRVLQQSGATGADGRRRSVIKQLFALFPEADHRRQNKYSVYCVVKVVEEC